MQSLAIGFSSFALVSLLSLPPWPFPSDTWYDWWHHVVGGTDWLAGRTDLVTPTIIDSSCVIYSFFANLLILQTFSFLLKKEIQELTSLLLTAHRETFIWKLCKWETRKKILGSSLC